MGQSRKASRKILWRRGYCYELLPSRRNLRVRVLHPAREGGYPGGGREGNDSTVLPGVRGADGVLREVLQDDDAGLRLQGWVYAGW